MIKGVGSAQGIPPLTVWIRAGGNNVKKAITPFIQKILLELPREVNSTILICTNENDTILEELNTIKNETGIKVIISQLSSYSAALTALAVNTQADSNVLTLSVGIGISEDQIRSGLESLRGRVKVYGWQVKKHKNDGSCPGKGWYNTAALLDMTIVEQIRQGIPKWVDNGVLGKIGDLTIGGNEEIPIMVNALERDPEAQFILNTKDRVSASLELGTGITFQEKIARKVVVGRVYMEKMYRELNKQTDLESWSKMVWESLIKL